MSRYRARDLLLVPCLLSLARIPLAAAFALALNRPGLELVILALAGLTDVLDGWYARRYGQVTAMGAVVDPITDKLFVLTVVVSLLVTERLSPVALLVLSTREIGEAPLVMWWVFSHDRRRARVEQPMANLMGKLATTLQFATVASALLRTSFTDAMLVLTGVSGVMAAASYWRREFAERDRRS